MLSLGLRVLTLLETQVRRGLAAAKETFTGLKEPRQETAQPTARGLLEAVARAEITLTRVAIGEQEHWHLTPLTGLLTRVLQFLGLSPALYQRLVENSS